MRVATICWSSAEPLGLNYRQGVPALGENLLEVIQRIASLDWISEYRGIRTLGCSAGGYAAILAGHHLGAEMAVSVGGRLPSKHRHPIRFLDMLYATWRSMRKRRCHRVLAVYAEDKSRDRRFAEIMVRAVWQRGKHGEICR